MLWGSFWSLIFIPLTLTAVYMSIHEGDTSRQYVPELRKIAAETPIFPASQKVADKVVLKQRTASLTMSYATNVPFAEIRLFYRRELPARGWALPKGPSDRFFDSDTHRYDYGRGDYFIDIVPNSGSNTYSVVFMWDPQ